MSLWSYTFKILVLSLPLHGCVVWACYLTSSMLHFPNMWNGIIIVFTSQDCFEGIKWVTMCELCHSSLHTVSSPQMWVITRRLPPFRKVKHKMKSLENLNFPFAEFRLTAWKQVWDNDTRKCLTDLSAGCSYGWLRPGCQDWDWSLLRVSVLLPLCDQQERSILQINFMVETLAYVWGGVRIREIWVFNILYLVCFS